MTLIRYRVQGYIELVPDDDPYPVTQDLDMLVSLTDPTQLQPHVENALDAKFNIMPTAPIVWHKGPTVTVEVQS